MHVARLTFPAPATEETWVTSQRGDPVFMVVAEPSESLAGELRPLLPGLRAIVGEGRRVTVCLDRGGLSATPRSSPPRPRPSATPAWQRCATRHPASRSPLPTR